MKVKWLSVLLLSLSMIFCSNVFAIDDGLYLELITQDSEVEFGVGYKFNNKFRLQLDYLTTDNITSEDVGCVVGSESLDCTAVYQATIFDRLNLHVKYMQPVTNNFYVYELFGMSYLEIEYINYSITTINYTIDEMENFVGNSQSYINNQRDVELNPLYGGGIMYDHEDFSAGIEYQNDTESDKVMFKLSIPF